MLLLSYFTLCICINIVMSSVDYLQHPVKSCHIGDLVENECNRCTCSSKTVFECKALDCKRNTTHSDLDDVKQCYPNQLYVQDLMTCICTKDGKWPHKSCRDAFQVLAPDAAKIRKCEPDEYVRIDCNVCRCGPDGQIINDRCTKNVCEEDGYRRTDFKSNNVYSKCEVKNWYSLAPCQFCYCVTKNKLVCNTGNYFSEKLELGSYNLRVCGRDMIREAIDLIPDNQKLLRLGKYLPNNTKKSIKQRTVNVETPRKKPKRIKISVEQDDGIDLNQENGENETPYLTLGKVGNNSSSDEYYSESKEEEVLVQPQAVKVHRHRSTTEKVITTEPPTTAKQTKSSGQFTQIPFEEDDETGVDKIEDEEDVNEESNETEVEDDSDPEPTTLPPRPSPVPAAPAVPTIDVETLQDLATGVKSAEYESDSNTLKINLPHVLNKVFQLALRKSMVSLTNGSKCKSGTTTVNGCNSCFCLKNSKLLCTNNVCPREKLTE